MLESFLEYLKPAISALDILIVAFLFYRIYILLSRTRAMQLLIGFAMILLVDVAARQLKLETLSWIVTNVSSYLVFGLIVLLQPELRRLVAEIGRMPVFNWINPPLTVPLDEIIEAVKNMAATKTGSIIVILQDIRPQSIIDNAVRIDSRISRELLQTIFFKDTPLHDGAVIIEGDKIVAASCYLPLSNSRQLKKTHGARHRAAMGISEETDAIVVVTSEETGKISILVNGDIRTGIKPIELKSLLFELLTADTGPRAMRGRKARSLTPPPATASETKEEKETKENVSETGAEKTVGEGETQK